MILWRIRFFFLWPLSFPFFFSLSFVDFLFFFFLIARHRDCFLSTLKLITILSRPLSSSYFFFLPRNGKARCMDRSLWGEVKEREREMPNYDLP